MVVRQHALTVVGEIRDGAAEQRLRDTLRTEAHAHDLLNALEEHVPSLHFGRFVIVTAAPGDVHENRPARLVFESNYDDDGHGDGLAKHLAQVLRALKARPGWEEAILGAWKGYEPGQLARFVTEHRVKASTFYLGHPGLPVWRIRMDEHIRLRLNTLLDEEHAAGRVKGRRPAALRRQLLARLAEDADARAYKLGSHPRGTPENERLAMATFALKLAPPVLAALTSVLWLVLVVEPREQRREAKDRALIAEDADILQRIAQAEDAIAQNGLTHYVALRPGPYRKALMKLVLHGVEQARQYLAYTGTLGGITSIHFARWVMLPDDSVLFLSNYDGSWESYLGDFVDKAHWYLSAVWSSTRWFPKTRGLGWGGASNESDFKQWVRTCQLENQLWYSAYRNLTVAEVNGNALLREQAAGEHDDDDAARDWLAKI